MTPEQGRDALADTIDRALEDAADRFVDSAEEALPLYGRLAWGPKQGDPKILEQVWDDLTESDEDRGSKRIIETGDGTVIVPHDPEETPVFDGTMTTPIPEGEQGFTETYPEDPEAGTPTIVVTPEGEEMTWEDYVTVFPDQSGVFPQGTIVTMENSKGDPTNLDVSGARIEEQDLLEKSLGVVRARDVDLYDAIHEVMNENGRLTTEENNTRTSQITLENVGNPIQLASETFDDLVRAAGGDPSSIAPKPGSRNNIRIFHVDGKEISMNVRDASSKHSKNVPTVEIQIRIDGQDKHDAIKFRF